MTLHWITDDDEQYSADSGDRTYIVGVFNVGAYDGDPTLTMYDDRYRSTCWSLTTGWATSLVALPVVRRPLQRVIGGAGCGGQAR
jgi:hypothetical protein